jgi:protein farnesyltransferase subunit beta
MSDAYHSCYVLSGLSAAQHKWELASPEGELAATGTEEPVWIVSPYIDGAQVFDEKDRVRPIHPVYAIPHQNQQAIMSYFVAKEGF